ncbi:hypothetical protein GCM10010495_70320 [Kitasatospora herbaricolor]|nr:hypothetical protein [Kitasatospora herbaricolor]GGV42742.1 hypothetical protein GCM10010495_70320 [Kitasatospora herbaricolor]
MPRSERLRAATRIAALPALLLRASGVLAESLARGSGSCAPAECAGDATLAWLVAGQLPACLPPVSYWPRPLSPGGHGGRAVRP